MGKLPKATTTTATCLKFWETRELNKIIFALPNLMKQRGQQKRTALCNGINKNARIRMKREINKRQAEPDKQGKDRKQNKNKTKVTKKIRKSNSDWASCQQQRKRERQKGEIKIRRASMSSASCLPLCLPLFSLPTNCPPRFTSLISQRRGYSNPTTRLVYGTLR